MRPKPTLLAAGALGLPLLALALSCGPRRAPIPVHASPLDLTLLAGEWSGEYSTRGGRSGYISFRLEAGADTARGQVLMYPETPAGLRSMRGEPDEPPVSPRVPTPIPVRFVWTERGQVQGLLAPYRDPDFGTTLRTSFRGDWQGEVIDGRFQSRESGGRVVQEGSWRVVRTGGAVEGTPSRVGLQGPSDEELVALGRRVFESRGCVECHGTEGEEPTGEAPDLAAVVDHRSFRWIYHMVMRPDSMLRHDPTAREMMAEFDRIMPVLDVTPWEALLLYEYLVERASDRLPRSP